MKKFAVAFAITFLALVALNAATYVLRSRSDGEHTYRRVGFPVVFWRQGYGYSRFGPVAFCADLAFAVWLSYRLARWWELRGTPDYIAGTKT